MFFPLSFFSFLERNNALMLSIYNDLMLELPKPLEDYQKEQEKLKKENGEDDDDEDDDDVIDYGSSPMKSLRLPSSIGTSEHSSVSSQPRYNLE